MVTALRCRGLLALGLLWVAGFDPALRAQASNPSGGCWSQTEHQVASDGSWLAKGVVNAPRNAVRARNLEWELPVAAASALLIAEADTPASRRIKSTALQRDSSRFSNIGLGLELASAATAYGVGCATHRESARDAGLVALEAAGAASAFDLALKTLTNRQRPSVNLSRGEFWEGGGSFPSSHAAASFAFASAIAHRYPRKPWVKWGAYAAAAAVSLARFPAKKHFLSDIVVGGTIGYVTGTYLASQPR